MTYKNTDIIEQSKTNIRGRNAVRHIFHTIPSRFRRLMLVGVALFTAVSVAMAPYGSEPAFAACSSSCVASMSASPSSGSYNPDNTVVVSVYVNSGGQTVNTVQADFTYTSSLLEFQSINAAGSAFSIDASSGGGGGSVSIARGNIAAVSGSSLLVAQVNFKVIGSAGTAAINFSSSSVVASSTTNQDILGSVSGATYAVTTPAPPATPPSTPPATGGSNPTTPSSGTAPKPNTSTPSTTAPAPTTPETTTTTTDAPKTDEPAAMSGKPVTDKNNTLLIVLVSAGIAIVAAGTAASWWFLRRRHSVHGPDLPPLANFVGSTSPPANPSTDHAPPFGPVGSPMTPASPPSQPGNNIPATHHADANEPFNWGNH